MSRRANVEHFLAAEQERAKDSDRRMQRLEQREDMAQKAEEVTKMTVTVFHCQEVCPSQKSVIGVNNTASIEL